MAKEDIEQQVIKVCPFSGKICIRDRRALWMEMTVGKPGMVVPQKQGMALFRLW